MKSTLHFLFLLLAVFCTGEMIGGRKNGKRKRTNAADIAEVRRTLVDLIKKKDLTNLQVYLEKFPEKHASSLTAAFCEEGESQFDSVFGSLNAALGTWLYHDPDFSTLDNKISHLLRFMKKKGADLSPIALMHLLILYDRMGKKEIEIEFVVRKVWDTWDYERERNFSYMDGETAPLYIFLLSERLFLRLRGFCGKRQRKEDFLAK